MNPPRPPAPTATHVWTGLLLLWLAGMASRTPMLATAPVIPLMHDDLHMTETQIGIMTALPLGMFALAAIPGALLIARFGSLQIATLGLLVCSLAAAARGAAFDVWTLYATSIAMGAGISIVQPTLPSLVRA